MGTFNPRQWGLLTDSQVGPNAELQLKIRQIGGNSVGYIKKENAYNFEDPVVMDFKSDPASFV